MRKKRIFENLQYFTLIFVIVGQCTVGVNFFFGQGSYLIANLISVIRCFVLNRPVADKVQDFSCLAITLGLIVMNILTLI